MKWSFSSFLKCRKLVGHSSVESMASPFCTLPEELRQEIISYLDYYDAWSLKKTSRLFLKVGYFSILRVSSCCISWYMCPFCLVYRQSWSIWKPSSRGKSPLTPSTQVVEIPTIQTFLAHPHGAALAMLEDWAIIPIGYEACYYCHRLLQARRFSRFQRWLTSARQKSGTYDYHSYNPAKHFCIKCGVRYGQYEKGRGIFVGYGDVGSTREVVTPCIHCFALFKDQGYCCRICGCCETCVYNAMVSKQKKLPVPFFFEEECEHRAFLEAGTAFFRWQIGWCDKKNFDLIERPRPKPEGEPLFSEYENLPPKELLEMVGEKMHEGERTIDEGTGTSGIKSGFLNTFEGDDYSFEHYCF